jgi:hypothetical protein
MGKANRLYSLLTQGGFDARPKSSSSVMLYSEILVIWPYKEPPQEIDVKALEAKGARFQFMEDDNANGVKGTPGMVVSVGVPRKNRSAISAVCGSVGILCLHYDLEMLAQALRFVDSKLIPDSEVRDPHSHLTFRREHVDFVASVMPEENNFGVVAQGDRIYNLAVKRKIEGLSREQVRNILVSQVKTRKSRLGQQVSGPSKRQSRSATKDWWNLAMRLARQDRLEVIRAFFYLPWRMGVINNCICYNY